MTVSASRVKETTTGTGTGDLTLAGAATGFRTFAAALTVGPGFPYVIALGSQWEVGTGHLSDATTLVRGAVLASSNGGALVNFTAGTKEVFCSLAGEQITAVGYDFLAATTVANQRTALGLGTAATFASSAFDAAGSAAAAQAAAIAASQPVDADLTAIAALTTTAHGRGLLTGADASATRTALGLGGLATQSGTYGNVNAADAASDTTTEEEAAPGVCGGYGGIWLGLTAGFWLGRCVEDDEKEVAGGGSAVLVKPRKRGGYGDEFPRRRNERKRDEELEEQEQFEEVVGRALVERIEQTEQAEQQAQEVIERARRLSQVSRESQLLQASQEFVGPLDEEGAARKLANDNRLRAAILVSLLLLN